MADPIAVARTDPHPRYNVLPDGCHAKITLTADPRLAFFEKTVQPPSWDNGDPIDITTMWNTQVMTKHPNCLYEIGDAVVKAAYDPMLVSNIKGVIGVNSTVTITWPNGDTLAYFGYLRKAEFDALERGTLPEATLTFTATNWDPVNCVEAMPIFTEAPGTFC
jgi:hypothetical protein